MTSVPSCFVEGPITERVFHFLQPESRIILACQHTGSKSRAVFARTSFRETPDIQQSASVSDKMTCFWRTHYSQWWNTVNTVKMTRKTSRRKLTVHWFRKGLRLSDNPALLRGIRRCETFRCIFILDPWFAGSSNVGTNKWRYDKTYFALTCQAQRLSCSRLTPIQNYEVDVMKP